MLWSIVMGQDVLMETSVVALDWNVEWNALRPLRDIGLSIEGNTQTQIYSVEGNTQTQSLR